MSEPASIMYFPGLESWITRTRVRLGNKCLLWARDLSAFPVPAERGRYLRVNTRPYLHPSVARKLGRSEGRPISECCLPVRISNLSFVCSPTLILSLVSFSKTFSSVVISPIYIPYIFYVKKKLLTKNDIARGVTKENQVTSAALVVTGNLNAEVFGLSKFSGYALVVSGKNRK